MVHLESKAGAMDYITGQSYPRHVIYGAIEIQAKFLSIIGDNYLLKN